MKVPVENPRGSVEKMSPKESVEGAHTVLMGSVTATERFPEGKPEAEQPRGTAEGAAECFPEENPEGGLTLPCSTV